MSHLLTSAQASVIAATIHELNKIQGSRLSVTLTHPATRKTVRVAQTDTNAIYVMYDNTYSPAGHLDERNTERYPNLFDFVNEYRI